jgi:hypothetical protein
MGDNVGSGLVLCDRLGGHSPGGGGLERACEVFVAWAREA